MKKRAKKLKHQPHGKFKAFLAENRITQKSIAELLNLSPVTVNQKINGTLHFTFDEVEMICVTYNIMPDLFLTRKVSRGDFKKAGRC